MKKLWKRFWWQSTRLSIVGLTLGLLTNQYIAISKAETSPQPPPELERLEYFEGTWRCQQPAASKNPVGVFHWTVKRDLNNFWYVGNAEETELPKKRKPINSREFLGYDTVNQKLFRFVVVGNGNSFNFTASNWQEDTFIWEGSAIEEGKIRLLRQEIVRENKNQFTATYFIKDRGGEWQPIVDENCDRID